MESLNGKLREGLLDRELFVSPAEARYLLDERRLDANQQSSPGHRYRDREEVSQPKRRLTAVHPEAT